MAIRLSCDLCERDALELVNDIILALQHWAIVHDSEDKYNERHFCPDCAKETFSKLNHNIGL